MQNSINASERKFQDFVENSVTAVFLVNDQGRYKYVNPAACQLLYYSYDELTNLSISDILPEEQVNLGLNHFLELKNSGVSNNFELKLRRKDGIIIDVILDGKKLSDDEYISFVKDISERKKLEQKVKESEEKLSVAQNIGNYGYWEYNIKEDKLYWSDQVYSIYEIEKDDFNLNFQNVVELFHPDDRQKVIDEYYVSTYNKTEFESTHRIITRKGKVKHITERCKTQYDKNGSPFSSLGTVQDVTKLKENEMALQKLNAGKDRFIKILAHDLRSPFSSLLGFSELLVNNLHELDKQEIEEYVRIIDQTTKRTYNLLEDLLLWIKSQTGSLPFQPELCNLGEICNEVLELQRVVAQEKNITINLINSYETIMKVDKNMLKTVFRNLVGNAIKFSKDNGKIDIVIEKNNTEALITVSDNGIGIEEQNLSKLWKEYEPYTTVGTRGEQGTGLGLSLCKEFVEKHGGIIWVESEFGKGSRFKFTIP